MSEPEPDRDSRVARGTIKGYYLWAFDKVADDHGGDADALTYIIGRWLDKDRDEAAVEFGITRETYRQWKAQRET